MTTKSQMKRRTSRGYWYAVNWIAYNDDGANLDTEQIEGYITTKLVADLFGREDWEVAIDVIQIRLRRDAGQDKWPEPTPAPKQDPAPAILEELEPDADPQEQPEDYQKQLERIRWWLGQDEYWSIHGTDHR